MNAETAIAKQIAIRQRRLLEATTDYVMQCHEKAIAKLVVQRMCNHHFVERGIGFGRTTLNCVHCKLSLLR